jgi:hypothetical protein
MWQLLHRSGWDYLLACCLFGCTLIIALSFRPLSAYAAEIYGVVRLTDGTPLAGKDIYGWPGWSHCGPATGKKPRQLMTTDTSGAYWVNLAPGRYMLQIEQHDIRVFVSPFDSRLDIILPEKKDC